MPCRDYTPAGHGRLTNPLKWHGGSHLPNPMRGYRVLRAVPCGDHSSRSRICQTRCVGVAPPDDVVLRATDMTPSHPLSPMRGCRSLMGMGEAARVIEVASPKP